jgi:hypothetical protein
MQEISLILLYVIVSWIIGNLLGRVNFVSIGIEKLMMLSSGVVLFFLLLNPAGPELIMWSWK